MATATREPDLQLKIFIVGPSGVGKSAMMQGYMDKRFPPAGVEPTTMLKMYNFKVSVEVGHPDISLVGVKAFDAGGEALKGYSEVMEAFYMGSKGGLIVYNAHDENSFEEVKSFWNPEMKRVLKSTNRVITVVASTRKGEQPSVNPQSAKAWANGEGMQFMQVEDINDINKCIQALCEDMCTFDKTPLEDMSLREQLAALMAELEELRRKLASAEQRCLDLEALKAAMMAQLAALEAENEANRAKMAELDARMAREREERLRLTELEKLKALEMAMAGKENAAKMMRNLLYRMQNLELATAVDSWKGKISVEAAFLKAAGMARRVLARMFGQAQARVVRQWKDNVEEEKASMYGPGGAMAKALQAEAAAAREALAAAQAQMAAVQSQLAAANQRMAAMEGEMKEMAAAFAAEKAAMAAAMKEKDALIDALNAQLADLLARLNNSDGAFGKANAIMQALMVEVNAAMKKMQELIAKDPEAIGLPSVYNAHRLEPLCEYKVSKASEVYQILLAKMQMTFNVAMPQFDKINKEKAETEAKIAAASAAVAK